MTMDEPQLIRRQSRYERNFTQIANSWLRDESLSFRARGVLSMVWSFPSGWRVLLKDLADASPSEGVDAVRTAVRELEEAGYLKRVPKKGVGSQNLGHDWEVCDPHEKPPALELLTASDNPTRHPDKALTALDSPTQTASDNPTPIETLFKHSKRVLNVTTERDPDCINRHGIRQHQYLDSDYCTHCGARNPQLTRELEHA